MCFFFCGQKYWFPSHFGWMLSLFQTTLFTWALTRSYHGGFIFTLIYLPSFAHSQFFQKYFLTPTTSGFTVCRHMFTFFPWFEILFSYAVRLSAASVWDHFIWFCWYFIGNFCISFIFIVIITSVLFGSARFCSKMTTLA